MNKIIFSILTIIFLIFPLYSQYLNVKISNVIIGEEWISINPSNTNQMVVGVIGYYPSQNSNMGYYYSSNSGFNWYGGAITSTLGYPASDPVMIVDTAGNYYYITMFDSAWGTPSPNFDKLFCFKSTNGGISWDNGTTFAQMYTKMNDMPMACVDFSNSIHRNNIYVTWSLYDSLGFINPLDSSYVYFSSSTNQGSTFSTPRRIGRIAGHGGNSSPEGPVPCVGKDGEIYVCFPHDSLIYLNKSTDAGNTWLPNDLIISTQAGGWFSHHSPVIVCDLSNSQYRGNVYVCFSDIRNGVNDRDIWFLKSTNSGSNWSNAVRVNDDAPGHYQELPWICVDPVTGYIWIAFYDTRLHSNYYADLFVARSTNGGNTFQNSKVSDTTTLIAAWNGDYIGISAYNNKVRPVWTHYVTGGISELWTGIIDTFLIGIHPISKIIPENFSLSQNYPNPFNPTTKIKFDIPKESFTKLIIYDLLGKEVETLINSKLQPGTYETEWDGSRYSSGVYFYKLVGGDFTKTIKMVLLK